MKNLIYILLFFTSFKLIAYTDSLQTERYKNGKLKSIIYFKDKKPFGIIQMFDTIGKLKETGFWDQSRWIGNYNYYYQNGQKSKQYNFGINGKRIGLQTEYFQNGIIKGIAFYNDGKIVEPYYNFDSLGNFINKDVGIFDSINKIDTIIITTAKFSTDSSIINYVKNENLNIFRMVNLSKSEAESKIKGEKLKSEKQKNLIYLVAAVIFGLSFIYILYNHIELNRSKTKIELQNKAIQHKQNEITDSINYSKRIQAAILPNIDQIKENFENIFIYYKPKDIVSGDFYYFNKINNDKFIAIADCTGHGVPGAFMSLIGSKELSIANSISDKPSEILKLLNNGVKLTLKQNEIEGTKDGMDIALLKISNNVIYYSGANRPLWIISKDTNEISEIKATKTAIAGFTPDNQEFSEHKLNLSSNDCLYIFSDGYADQFGGDKDKKMTTKRFKELLVSINHLSMNDQQNLIDNYFKQWQGNKEQVDDILVIGIKI